MTQEKEKDKKEKRILKINWQAMAVPLLAIFTAWYSAR